MFSIYLIILLAVLAAWKKTRRFAFYFLPWFLFGIIYDSMRLYPNYMVNDIDVANLYHAEKSLFGIAASSSAELQAVADHTQLMILGEYFKVHHCGFADFWAGIFYLCWVPVPIAFALYLYLTKQLKWFRRFSWAFLLVNVIGFIGYYIYPAAPPWYAMNYGFKAVLNTPGNVAGLGRWDEMTGLQVFHGLYGKNANVFAAVPSLHAAYMFLTTIYAVMSRKRWYTVVLFACICLGIWWTAVYSGHHYIIDVMLGILTTIVGVLLMESKRLWARLKAELTASCASVIDFGLAFFLSDIVGIYYGLANALGVISGGITNCILNYRYVFGDSKSKKKSVAWRYFIIWGISWMLNSGGTIALTEFLNAHEHIQLHYMIPKSIVSLLVAIFVNYPGQKKFVFKQK